MRKNSCSNKAQASFWLEKDVDDFFHKEAFETRKSRTQLLNDLIRNEITRRKQIEKESI